MANDASMLKYYRTCNHPTDLATKKIWKSLQFTNKMHRP